MKALLSILSSPKSKKYFKAHTYLCCEKVFRMVFVSCWAIFHYEFLREQLKSIMPKNWVSSSLVLFKCTAPKTIFLFSKYIWFSKEIMLKLYWHSLCYRERWNFFFPKIWLIFWVDGNRQSSKKNTFSVWSIKMIFFVPINTQVEIWYCFLSKNERWPSPPKIYWNMTFLYYGLSWYSSFLPTKWYCSKPC